MSAIPTLFPVTVELKEAHGVPMLSGLLGELVTVGNTYVVEGKNQLHLTVAARDEVTARQRAESATRGVVVEVGEPSLLKRYADRKALPYRRSLVFGRKKPGWFNQQGGRGGHAVPKTDAPPAPTPESVDALINGSTLLFESPRVEPKATQSTRTSVVVVTDTPQEAKELEGEFIRNMNTLSRQYLITHVQIGGHITQPGVAIEVALGNFKSAEREVRDALGWLGYRESKIMPASNIKETVLAEALLMGNVQGYKFMRTDRDAGYETGYILNPAGDQVATWSWEESEDIVWLTIPGRRGVVQARDFIEAVKKLKQMGEAITSDTPESPPELKGVSPRNYNSSQQDKAIKWFAKMKLPTLRKRQDVTQQQIRRAFNQHNDDALQDLQMLDLILGAAVNLKEFGESKSPKTEAVLHRPPIQGYRFMRTANGSDYKAGYVLNPSGKEVSEWTWDNEDGLFLQVPGMRGELGAHDMEHAVQRLKELGESEEMKGFTPEEPSDTNIEDVLKSNPIAQETHETLRAMPREWLATQRGRKTVVDAIENVRMREGNNVADVLEGIYLHAQVKPMRGDYVPLSIAPQPRSIHEVRLRFLRERDRDYAVRNIHRYTEDCDCAEPDGENEAVFKVCACQRESAEDSLATILMHRMNIRATGIQKI